MKKIKILLSMMTAILLSTFSAQLSQASDSVFSPVFESEEKHVSSIVDTYALENNLTAENKTAAHINILDALKNDYKVNWGIFDFSNTNHDIQATAVAQVLDRFLSDKISHLTKSVAYAQGDTDKMTQLYAQRAALSEKQTYVMNSWSAAFTNDPSFIVQ